LVVHVSRQEAKRGGVLAKGTIVGRPIALASTGKREELKHCMLFTSR
jgi:hypothetical protein